ncbi:phage antirepressor KilAC domain-containing protein [Geomicrobium sp. JCM 19039]|uniref:phage antirepressor KilAC domain-containing protein n=1 Tax=Geomicrobium sp. JCM 19039 TaxID=1460636 RepID=UPI001EE6700B|nr:phage antirepressor KilAC domain-containing protein [Geomicrobium sp. JCM 19039]
MLQQIFNYHQQEVRTVIINDEPWFVAKDVCDVLEINNSRQALTRLDDDEKAEVTLNDGRQNRLYAAVNESGLYELIFASRKKEAKAFKRWVKQDVLPQVRQTGKYEVDKPSYTINDPILRAKAWIREQEQVQLLEQKAAEYEHKARYVDQILASKGTVTTTQIAKDYGMSGVKLNAILKDEKVQYKQNGQWLLYSQYQDKGYVESNTVDITHRDGRRGAVMHNRWTQKGRLFIHDILEKNGIIALRDQQLTG